MTACEKGVDSHRYLERFCSTFYGCSANSRTSCRFRCESASCGFSDCRRNRSVRRSYAFSCTDRISFCGSIYLFRWGSSQSSAIESGGDYWSLPIFEWRVHCSRKWQCNYSTFGDDYRNWRDDVVGGGGWASHRCFGSHLIGYLFSCPN